MDGWPLHLHLCPTCGAQEYYEAPNGRLMVAHDRFDCANNLWAARRTREQASRAAPVRDPLDEEAA